MNELNRDFRPQIGGFHTEDSYILPDCEPSGISFLTASSWQVSLCRCSGRHQGRNLLVRFYCPWETQGCLKIGYSENFGDSRHTMVYISIFIRSMMINQESWEYQINFRHTKKHADISRANANSHVSYLSETIIFWFKLHLEWWSLFLQRLQLPFLFRLPKWSHFLSVFDAEVLLILLCQGALRRVDPFFLLKSGRAWIRLS